MQLTLHDSLPILHTIAGGVNRAVYYSAGSSSQQMVYVLFPFLWMLGNVMILALGNGK